MRFDLSGCGAGLDESARSLLELGPLAESLGYDGLRINEEHFGQGRRVYLSPILPATALAMRTRRIGTGFQENAARTLELFASKVTPCSDEYRTRPEVTRPKTRNTRRRPLARKGGADGFGR